MKSRKRITLATILCSMFLIVGFMLSATPSTNAYQAGIGEAGKCSYNPAKSDCFEKRNLKNCICIDVD